MSWLWILRIIFITCLFIMIIINGIFLKDRQRYSNILNNRPLNSILVIIYNAFCYLSAGVLPSDPRIFTEPLFFHSPIILTGFQVFGIALLVFGVFLLIRTVTTRRTIGAEETEQGLITSGIYTYFRHPIYTGIFLISFAIALNSINFDGFLILPLIFAANASQAKIEEKYDVGATFKVEYDDYRKKTRMFGPLWFWLIIIVIFILLIGISYISYSLFLIDFF